MFAIRRPRDAAVREHLVRQRRLPLSYDAVGASRDPGSIPRDFRVDHQRVELGRGDEVFARARRAIGHWTMFDLGWVELCWPAAPIERGTTVGVLARTFPLYSLSACRVVYVIDEPDRFGFAYGTLPDHVGRGEERFLVELDRDRGDRVFYDLLAFSRPGKIITALGYPGMRVLQRRFRRDSASRMKRAACGSAATTAPSGRSGALRR